MAAVTAPDPPTPRIDAFVLAGGFGTRLAPLTTVIPKPLVPVGDRAILELLVAQLVHHGITHVTVSLGYLGHLIRAVLGDGSALGATITYTEEDEPLGTAGALGLLDDDRSPDHVLVLNGDTFTDLDFTTLLDGHVRSGADVTIAAHHQDVRIDYGVLLTNGDGRLTGYDEKPTISYLVSMGVNVVAARTLARLRPVRRIDFPSFLDEVRHDGGVVRCHETDCTWLDLGRISDVHLANEAFAAEPDRFLPRR